MNIKEIILRCGRGAEFYPSSQLLRARLEDSPHQEAISGYFSEHDVSIEELFRWPQERRSLLSDIGILRHFLAGNIIVEPFDINRLQSNGYDVSLGENYFVYSRPAEREPFKFAFWGRDVHLHCPLDGVDVTLSWGKAQKAVSVKELMKSYSWSAHAVPGEMREGWERFFNSFENDDQIIILEPNQMILGHTQEFIGGRNAISTTISGKSSLGRSMVEVCSDANLGDVGFTNRWTLELTNKSKEVAIALLVGQPVATIQFIEVEPPITSYGGVYQFGQTLEEIKANWDSQMMLPKMRKKK